MVLPGLLHRRRKGAVTGLIIQCGSWTVYCVHRVVYCAPRTHLKEKKGKKGTKHTQSTENSMYVFCFVFILCIQLVLFFVFNALVFKRSCSRVGLSFIAEKGLLYLI